MTEQVINVGSTGNDGTGDKLRPAFIKVQSNFDELYNDNGNSVNAILTLSNNIIYVENEANAAELQSRARTCRINTDEIGVPFIYYKGQCYVGEDEGIQLLEQLIGGVKS